MNNPIFHSGPLRISPRMDLENVRLKVGDQILGPLYVLEWSRSQQAFHVQTLVEAIQDNMIGFFHEGKTGDYVILGLFSSREAVDEYYNLMLEWSRSQQAAKDIDNLLDDLSP